MEIIRLRSIILASALCIAGAVQHAAAQAVDAARATVYALKDAGFAQGCFEPCDCPLALGESLRGTFSLRLAKVSGTELVYAVDDVNWYVDFGGAELHITGAGKYRRISGFAGWLHQMTLKLSIDGAETVEFDTGLVNGGGDFPDITGLTLSMNGLVCFDTAISINASVATVKCYTLGTQSTYQEGCLSPCLCPILVEQPLVGQFGLVEIANEGTYIEYAVVNANWKVQSAFDPPSSTFRGYGRYTRISGFAGWIHRMELELSVDGSPREHFDSGGVNGGGNFPAIDIAVAENDFYCYDIVLDLHAKPCVSIGPAASADEAK